MMSLRIDHKTKSALDYALLHHNNKNKSILVRKLINEFLEENRNGVVRKIIFSELSEHNFNKSVTISFVRAKDSSIHAEEAYRSTRNPRYLREKISEKSRLPLFERHRPDGDRMVKAYFSAMRRDFGRNKVLSAVAICETKKRNRIDPTFLHYHCLLDVAEENMDSFALETGRFWARMGIRQFGEPIECQVEDLRSKEAALNYALKNVDDDYPIDQIIMVGT